MRIEFVEIAVEDAKTHFKRAKEFVKEAEKTMQKMIKESKRK